MSEGSGAIDDPAGLGLAFGRGVFHPRESALRDLGIRLAILAANGRRARKQLGLDRIVNVLRCARPAVVGSRGIFNAGVIAETVLIRIAARGVDGDDHDQHGDSGK